MKPFVELLESDRDIHVIGRFLLHFKQHLGSFIVPNELKTLT